MPTSALSIRNLTVAYHNKPVLWNINATIPQGVMLAIAGPNGAGKSTLIKSIIQLVRPHAGTIEVLGGTYAQNRHQIAYIPQRTSIDWDFPINIFDVVLMGRYGHLGWFKRPTKKDHEHVARALHQVGLSEHATRHIGELSCGQQQRVFLARALAQDASLYLMDEPFIGVDATTEKMTIAVLKQLKEEGKTIIVVHHDLQTMQEYFDWLLLLNIEQIFCGPLETPLTHDYMQATFKKNHYFHSNL